MTQKFYQKLLEKYFPLNFLTEQKGFSIPLVPYSEMNTHFYVRLRKRKKFGILDEQITQNELNAFILTTKPLNYGTLNFQLWCRIYG